MNNAEIMQMFEYPFSVIRDESPYNLYSYNIEDIFTPLFGSEETVKDCEGFPNNIDKVLWAQEGENDAEEWILLCQLNNGLFAYYIAFCDYTGFDCQGGMDLYVAKTSELLIKNAANDRQRGLLNAAGFY
jgi:hypothetical protein